MLQYIQQYADSVNRTTYNFDVFTGGAYPTRRLLIAVAFRIGTNTGIYSESMSLTVGPNTIKFRKVAESRNWNQYASCIAWFEGEVPEGTRATVSPTLSHEVLRCGVTVYSFDGSEYEIGPSYGLFDGNNTDQSSRHGDFNVDLEPGGIAVVGFARSATAPTLGGYEPDNDGLDLESNVFFIQTGQYTNRSEVKSTRRIYEVVSSGTGSANACLAVVTLKPGSNNCPQELIDLEPRLWMDPSDGSSTNWGDDDGHLNTWMNKSYLNSIDPIHTPDNDKTARGTINGLPAIRSYGASFTTNANSVSGMTDGTVYCVCVSYGSGSNNTNRNGAPYRFSGAGSSNDHFGGSADGLRGWYQSLETTSRPNLKADDPGIFEGDVYLQKLSVEDNTLKPALNGRALTEVSGGTQTGWGAGTIGTASSSWKWNGLWGELIILDTVPDAATDALITNYLMNKWGIGISEHVPEEGEVLCIKDGIQDVSPYKRVIEPQGVVEYTHKDGLNMPDGADYLIVDNFLKASTSYTVEIWFRSTTANSTAFLAVGAEDAVTSARWLGDSGSGSAAVGLATNPVIYMDAQTINNVRSDHWDYINDGEIHHAVLTVDEFTSDWISSALLRIGSYNTAGHSLRGIVYKVAFHEGVQWDLDKVRSKYRDGYHFAQPDKWLGLNGEVASLVGSRQVYKLPDHWDDGSQGGYKTGLYVANSENFEIDFYVRLDDMTNYNPCLETRGQETGKGFTCTVESTGDGGNMVFNFDGSGDTITSTTVFEEDRTYHIRLNKRDNSLFQLWVDGVLEATDGALTTGIDSETPLYVGSNELASANNTLLNGEMWGIRVAWGEGLNESGGKRFFLDGKDDIKKGLTGFITTLQTAQSIQLANFQHPQNWTYVIRVQRNDDNDFTLINRSDNAASYLGLGVDGNASTGSATFSLNTLYVDGRRIDSPATLTRGDWFDLIPEGKTVTIAVAGTFSTATEYNQTHTWQFGRLTTFTTLTMRGDWSVIRLFNRQMNGIEMRLLSLDAELQLPNTNGAEFVFDPTQEKWLAKAFIQDLSGKNTNFVVEHSETPECWQTDGGLTSLDFSYPDTGESPAQTFVGLGNPIASFVEFSVGGWFKPDAAASNQYVMAQREDEAIGWWELMLRSGAWRMEVKNTGGTEYNSPSQAKSDDWEFVVGVFTGSHVQLFVQGVFVGQTATTGQPAPTAGAAIGLVRDDPPGNASSGYTGQSGYTFIRQRAMTEEEIYHEYLKTRNRYQADVTIPTLPPGTTHYYTSEEPVDINKARAEGDDAVISSIGGLKVRDNSGFIFDGSIYLQGTRHRTTAISKMSAAIWVKFTETSTLMVFMGCWASANDKSWVLYQHNTDPGRFFVGLSGDGSSTFKYWHSAEDISDGAWHLIGFTFNSGELRMFLDREEITSTVAKDSDDSFTTMYASTEAFAIGAQSPSAAVSHFTGEADRAAIAYDEVWSPSVFRELHEAGPQASIPALPTQRYHRNAVAVMNGSTIDQSGNNNALTAVGSPSIVDNRYTFSGSANMYGWGLNQIGPQLEGAEGFGFVGWIHVNTTANGDRPFSVWQHTSAWLTFGLNFNAGGQLVCAARSRPRNLENAPSTSVTTDAFPTGRAVHVAASVDLVNNDITIWLDAVEVGQTKSINFELDAYVHDDHTGAEQDGIGGRIGLSTDTIDGWMSDVQVIAAPIDEGFVKEHARREGAGINRWDATHHPKTLMWMRDGFHDSSYRQTGLIRNKSLTIDEYGVVSYPSGYPRIEIEGGTDFTSYTISCYVMNEANDHCVVFNRKEEANSLTNSEIELYTANASENFTVLHNRSGSQDALGTSGGEFPNNVFTHAVTTYDEATTTLRIFANGTQVAEDTAFTAPTNTAGRKSWIGHWGGYNSGTQSGGKIQDVRIIEQAVTPGYAALLWNKGVPGKEIKCMVAGEVLDVDPSLYKVEWPHDHLFDGTAAARIDTPIQIPQGDYEWECNFNIAVLEDYGTILAQRNDSGGGASFNFRVNADGSGTYVHVAQGTYSFPTGFFVADRDYHFRIVYDHSTTSADFYVDGELIAGNQSLSGFNASTTTKVTIGARPDGAGSGQEFTGRIWGLKFAFGGIPDESGNNPPAASTPFSNGLSVEDGVFRFAGTSANQQIVFDDVFPSDDSDRTICCLVKFDDDSFETNATFGIFDTAPGQVGAIRLYKRGTSIGGDNNGLNIEAGGQTAGSFWEWPSRLNGKWVSLILTANRSDASVDINLYVQGVYVFSRNTTGSAPAVNTVRFGALNNTNPMPANSYMAGMKVFDRVLTDEEISRVHAHMMGKVSIQDFAGAQYAMLNDNAQAVGTTIVVDDTGKNANGSFVNMNQARREIETLNDASYRIDLDGTNDIIETSYAREIDTVFEVAAVLNFDDFVGNQAICGDRTNQTNDFYVLVTSSTTVQIGAGDGTVDSEYKIFTVDEMTAGTYYYFHVKYTPGTNPKVQLWINAVDQGEFTLTGNSAVADGTDLDLGGTNSSGSVQNDFGGKYLNFMTFNYPTTQRMRKEMSESWDWRNLNALTTTVDEPDPEPSTSPKNPCSVLLLKGPL